jgi:aminoglycoside 6-adenylyltransferase
MRSEDEIKNLIIAKAKSDDRIRAVLLNGSRANGKILPDKYQDFDIVYIVNDVDIFIADHHWTDFFGDRIIWQLPGEMTFGDQNDKEEERIGFNYLMLFKDGNRIDLSLFPKDKIETKFSADSLTIVWLDKDKLFLNIKKSTDTDYLIKRPNEQEFSEVCNEFWWVSTYVSKGLLRGEITYAKQMMETIVRPMFMKIIEWSVGVETDFSVSFGKGGKFMKQYVSDNQYLRILTTYANHLIEDNWRSLFIMMELFAEFANIVANKLNFKYNSNEENNVTAYLIKSYQEQK